MKRLVHRRWNLAAYIAVFTVLFFAVCLPAFGQIAGPGYDAFQTGSGASVDLTSIGIGVVNLQGVPLPSSTAAGPLGNTDTIMYSPQAIPAGGGTVPVNLYALSMKSSTPVTFMNQQADVYITVNNTGGVIPTGSLPQPDTLTPSTGTITVYPSTSTFDSSITINADVIIVKTGGNPANTSVVLANQPANSVTMTQTGSSYSTTPPANYPLTTTSPLGSPGIYFRPVHTAPTHNHPVVPASVPASGCAIATPVTDPKTSNSKNSNSTTLQPNCEIERF
jgi:hypothetical protein